MTNTLQSAEQREHARRWRARLKRQQRYERDPAFKARVLAKITALVKRRGGSTEPGPGGWPKG